MLTVILKGTNACNLDCAYCSLGEKTDLGMLTADLLENILDYICRVCRVRKESMFQIILHGGEPTLVPTSVYRTAFNMIKRRYPDIEIKVSMQTNAFHISNKMLDFLKEYHVKVGVSIDGSKEIHNAERRSKNHSATYETVINNIELLLDNQIEVSCLMVLTSEGLRADYSYIHYFERKGLHLKINPLLDYGEVYKNTYLSLAPGDYAEYLIGLFEYIVSNEIDVDVSPIDKYLRSVVYRMPMTECTYNPKCNTNFLCIDYQGNIYPCGKFADSEHFLLGNIKSAPERMEETDLMKQLLSRRGSCKPQDCKLCKYVSKCNSGCSAETAIENDISCVPKLCIDYQRLFSYFEKEGLIFLRNNLQKKKESLLVKKENEL